jgi:membrane fusion protein, multidrug efflux system
VRLGIFNLPVNITNSDFTMKSKLKITVFSAITAMLLLAGCSAGHKSRHTLESDLSDPIQVQKTRAAIEKVTLYNETTGTVHSKNRASIAPKVTGQITLITVVPGQRIRKDDLLVKISALEISSKLQSAQATMDKVRRDLKREQELLASDASTPEIVNDLVDQLRIAEATVREAETILSYTEVRAPFDGVVTRKYAHEGDLSLPGHPLLDIENLKNLQVEADIPEVIAIRLKVGTAINVEVAGAESTITGIIEEIAPAADPVSRTFPIKISLPKNVELKSGQFAKVRIPSKIIETVLVDPNAVSRWGQIERVFVVKDNRLHMRIVKTGSQYGDRVEVLSGLSGGEELAIRVDQPLEDGIQVL